MAEVIFTAPLANRMAAASSIDDSSFLPVSWLIPVMPPSSMICSSVPVDAEISRMPSDINVATGKERKLDAIRPMAEMSPSQKKMISRPRNRFMPKPPS